MPSLNCELGILSGFIPMLQLPSHFESYEDGRLVKESLKCSSNALLKVLLTSVAEGLSE